MARDIIDNDLLVTGNATIAGDLKPLRARSGVLAQEQLVAYPVDLTLCRVWNALHTPLSDTPASDDLGIGGNTWATDAPFLTAGDLKAAGATTRRCRFKVVLPPEYEAGETVKIRVAGGMLTSIADVSATVDLEVFVNGRDRTIDGIDLYVGAAQSINSTSHADKDFTITETALTPGTALDVRLSIAVNDAATATAVIATIGAIDLLCDIRG